MVYLDFYGGTDIRALHGGTDIKALNNPNAKELDKEISKYGVENVFKRGHCRENRDARANLQGIDGTYFTNGYAYGLRGDYGSMLVVVSRKNRDDFHFFRMSDPIQRHHGSDTVQRRYIYVDQNDMGSVEWNHVRSVLETVDRNPLFSVQEGVAEFFENISQGNVKDAVKAVNARIGWLFWAVVILVAIMFAWVFTQNNGLYSMAFTQNKLHEKSFELMSQLTAKLEAAEKETKDLKEGQQTLAGDLYALAREHSESKAMSEKHSVGLQAMNDLIENLSKVNKQISSEVAVFAGNLKELAISHTGLQYTVSELKQNVEDQFAAFKAKLGRIPGVMEGIEGSAGGLTTTTVWNYTYTYVTTLIVYGLAFAFFFFIFAACKLVGVRRREQAAKKRN